ncbi:MAG: DUF4868 domain-containing protein [Gallionellales bacterium 35-53-114]|jgi:hypothetical protein|nr:MAG: DUF4868 domain-containing protein [Gallionellales bacterium 35-53-114]OYZ62729.1 MAG: DUF4868 domain-containing protein [Gallionellales bacterium 24-53-125]OZB09805.1 MAG: DUF4868 domain-containing protein [Gallionellales bacterium 39-52-133]HQS57628.1 DUF4868 domain-containing protein [Gallionellaceae bacterium]HQS74082.1 DUF4868 domain-containing protein [Gallionellaceae bacterium]
MPTLFNSLRAFDYINASAHLWVFKKSIADIKFKANYVPTDQSVTNALKSLIQAEMARITEFSSYTYLSETNENSCLTTPMQETDFKFLKTQVDRPETECHVQGINNLKGAEGYLVKFSNNGETIYAVKRSTSTWKTSYPKRFINVIFADGELAATEDNGFSIERNFDFFCNDTKLFIANKRGFESVMSCRTAYTQAFSGLQANPPFAGLFTNMAPLIDYVGNNSMHLRRMAVVEQKGLYESPNFLGNLKRVSDNRGWGINFDATTNQIVACDQTVKAILQVLLDHRLMSEVTDCIYDVPDATQI